MGFGSYDEAEQEKRSMSTEFDENAGEDTSGADHDGDVEFEFTVSNDELLDQLKNIKKNT